MPNRRTLPMTLLLATIALAATPLATSAAAQDTQPQKVRAIVSILPQAYFVERVGGDAVQVDVLVGPGQSPHSFDPTPRQLDALSRAAVFFRIGVDFEASLLPRVERTFKDLKVVDTRAGVPLRRIGGGAAAPNEHDHAGHEHGDHDHGGPGDKHDEHVHTAADTDPHTWLNPLHVKTQAQTICDTLVRLDPARAEQYRKNLAAFHADLGRLHAKLTETLAPYKGREVFVFHPAFGYFTDAYGLKQVPVEVDGKEPSARQLGELIDRAKAAGARTIFVQPQFPTRSAEAVAQAIGGRVETLDDLPRDYLKAVEEMGEKVRDAFKN